MSGSAFGRVQVSLENNWGFFLTGSNDICIESCWQLINMGSGWSAPIQVTLCPIDSCYSLNRGIRHLERSFHLSSTQGYYHLHSQPWGIINPQRDSELSPLTIVGDYHPLERIITSHWPGGLSPLQRIILSHNPGGLSTLREDYHLSPCRFRTVTPICYIFVYYPNM